MHPKLIVHAKQRRVFDSARNSDAYTFFNVLTGPELFNQVEAQLPAHRERLFPPTETLSMFLAQALSADRSCQKAVNEAAVKRVAGELRACSTNTGAYCQARQRVPLEMVRTLAQYAGGRGHESHARLVALAGSAGTAGGWHYCAHAGHTSQSG